MKFEIPFDGTIYANQNILHFDSVWRKNLKKRNENLLVGFVFLLLGVLIVVGKNNIGVVFIGLGIFALNYAHRLNKYYYINKKNLYTAVEKNIKEYAKQNQTSIWELDNESFYYRDYKLDSKMQWTIFSGYRRIDETIFLDSNIGMYFMISKCEIGDENFDKLVEFLGKKFEKPAANTR